MANQKGLKASVIVPAYNIENYLPACLDSILAQDFQDFEIIIVDDGSTDNTPKICDEYQKKSMNINVIHQKNAGLSAARNTGIKQSKGEYLAFIDGDDIIAPDFLSRLLYAAERTSAEVAICGFLEFTDKIPQTTPSDRQEIYTSKEAVKKLLISQENYYIIVCNKLYKRELFKNTKFPIGELHEDNLTTYKLLAEATRVVTVSDKLYFYRKREGSIMAEQDLLARLKIKERAAKEAIEYFDNTPDLKQAARVALLLSKFAYLDNVASGKIHDQNLWQKTVKEIKNSKKAYLKNPYLTKKLKLYLNLLNTPAFYKIFRKIIHE